MARWKQRRKIGRCSAEAEKPFETVTHAEDSDARPTASFGSSCVDDNGMTLEIKINHVPSAFQTGTLLRIMSAAGPVPPVGNGPAMARRFPTPYRSPEQPAMKKENPR
jgi:hypothetical protein